MNDFIPSPDFVEKTMRTIEASESTKYQLTWCVVVTVLVRYIGIIGASLVGVFNVIKLITKVFTPIVCY